MGGCIENPQTKVWMIYDSDKKKFIGLDQASGGYPHETDIFGAHRFPSASAAVDYYQMFKKDYPGWEVWNVDNIWVWFTESDADAVVNQAYNDELDALNRKYGRT